MHVTIMFSFKAMQDYLPSMFAFIPVLRLSRNPCKYHGFPRGGGEQTMTMPPQRRGRSDAGAFILNSN